MTLIERGKEEFRKVGHRATNIILTPKTEWAAIEAEEPVPLEILPGYVIPLAIIPAAASILGFGVVGRGAFTSLAWGVATAVVGLLTAVAGVYASAFAVDALAPKFESRRNFGRAVQLVAYSLTPVWLAGVLYIVPALGMLPLVALAYGAYILYVGLRPIMKTPHEEALAYAAVSVIVIMLAGVALRGILTFVVDYLFDLGSTPMLGG